MTYTKTIWVPGGAPGINATRLNNMEEGIEDAHDHMARNDNPHGVTAAQIGAANILAQLLTVDGPTSGFDAATVRGWFFRDTNGYPEYSTDNGGTWKTLGMATMVASDTIQEQQATEYGPTAGGNYRLVYKFVPKTRGEIVVEFDMHGDSGLQSYLHAFSGGYKATNDVASYADIYVDTYNPVGGSSFPFDYRTPIGTVVSNVPSNQVAVLQSISSGAGSSFTTYSKVLRVVSPAPIYFVLEATDSNNTYEAAIKNIKIKYDLK